MGRCAGRAGTAGPRRAEAVASLSQTAGIRLGELEMQNRGHGPHWKYESRQPPG